MTDRVGSILITVLVLLGCALAIAAPAIAQPSPDAASAPTAADPADAGATMPADAAPATGEMGEPDALVVDVPESEDLAAKASAFVAAVRAGQWREAVGLLLMLVVGGVLRFGRRLPLIRSAWEDASDDETPRWRLSDARGTAVAFGAALLLALGASLLAGPLSLDVASGAVGAGVAAVGLHRLWRQVLRPALRWLVARFD